MSIFSFRVREAHLVNPSLEAGRGLGRRGLSLGVGMGLGLGRGLGLGVSRSGAHLVDRSRGSRSGPGSVFQVIFPENMGGNILQNRFAHVFSMRNASPRQIVSKSACTHEW